MEELGSTTGYEDSGRYDNDFEKLPHDVDVISSTEPPAVSGSPAGDTKSAESETMAEETSPSKSQLDVEKTAVETPELVKSDDKGATCAGCES